jgi:hypothetical protein
MRGNGLDTSPAQFRERPALSGAASLAGHQDRSALPLDRPGRSAIEREAANGTTSLARAVLLVLLPFAAGYYLSYLYRSINALIAGDLVTELGLSAADLGLLTSVYFLAFAAVQLPAACSSTGTGRGSSTAPCSSLPPSARSCSPLPTAWQRSLSAAP